MARLPTNYYSLPHLNEIDLWSGISVTQPLPELLRLYSSGALCHFGLFGFTYSRQNVFSLRRTPFLPFFVSHAALRDLRGKEKLARGVEAARLPRVTLTSAIDLWKIRDGEHSVKWSKKERKKPCSFVCACLMA